MHSDLLHVYRFNTKVKEEIEEDEYQGVVLMGGHVIGLECITQFFSMK